MGGGEDNRDRVGFYLLPRSAGGYSTSSSPRKQNGNTEQSSNTCLSHRTGKEKQGRSSSRRRDEKKLQNIDREIRENAKDETTRIGSKSRYNRKDCSRTAEVLFDTTPLYLPKGQKEKKKETSLQKLHQENVKESVKEDIKPEKKGVNSLKQLTEKSTELKSMLSKRSLNEKQSPYDDDVEELSYQDSYEDKPESVFRSVAPGTGDIHNMRIQAGIMINTGSRRVGEGRYNQAR